MLLTPDLLSSVRQGERKHYARGWGGGLVVVDGFEDSSWPRQVSTQHRTWDKIDGQFFYWTQPKTETRDAEEEEEEEKRGRGEREGERERERNNLGEGKQQLDWIRMSTDSRENVIFRSRRYTE